MSAAANVVLISGGATAPVPPAREEGDTPPSLEQVTTFDTPVDLMSLNQLEQELEAIENTADLVPEEQRAEFVQRFRAVYAASAKKIDRTHHVLTFLDALIARADEEARRQQDRKKRLTRHRDNLEKYVVWVIESLGTDAKQRHKKLEGDVVTLSIRKCPPSVEIVDEFAVPAEYKNATVTIPLDLWETLLDALDVDAAAGVIDAIRRPEITVRKVDVKEALAHDVAVAGARYAKTKYSLLAK